MNYFGGDRLIGEWTAEVVGRMHLAGITGKQLAEECGITNSYLSTVLHGKKGDENTRQRILAALERLEANRPAKTAGGA